MIDLTAASSQRSDQLSDLFCIRSGADRGVECLFEASGRYHLHGPSDLADVRDRFTSFDYFSCTCHFLKNHNYFGDVIPVVPLWQGRHWLFFIFEGGFEFLDSFGKAVFEVVIHFAFVAQLADKVGLVGFEIFVHLFFKFGDLVYLNIIEQAGGAAIT